jgi:hypothetical protein
MLSVALFIVILNVVMLSAIILNVVMLSVVMLSVVMLSVVMLSVVMLSVVAPLQTSHGRIHLQWSSISGSTRLGSIIRLGVKYSTVG